MLKNIIFSLFIILLSCKANAEELTVHQAPEDCASMLAHPQHFADDDVAFKPGLDAYGKPVEGPEYKGGGAVQIEPPKSVTLDIHPDVSGVPVPNGSLEGQAGSVKIDLETGQVITDEMKAEGLSPKEAYHKRYEACLKASKPQ